jgi:hypothetical protein
MCMVYIDYPTPHSREPRGYVILIGAFFIWNAWTGTFGTTHTNPQREGFKLFTNPT